MNKIEYYWWRLRQEFCRRYHLSYVYETRVGIKGIYGVKSLPAIPLNTESFECKPGELFLGIDYLKDQYTLLGCTLLESPHFAFMKALLKHEDLSKTDYIYRCENGIIDGRVASLNYSNFDYFKKTFKEKYDAINNNVVSPVYVYRINGKMYIYDGKHRAALCALLGKPIVCMEVSNERFGSTMSLILNNEYYSKHIDLYKKAIVSGKKFI